MFQDEDGKASLIVHVLPLRANTFLDPANQVYPVAGLVIVDCHQGMNDRISVFVDLFTLTPAEACVVSQLVLGGELTKVASRLNIALSTARSHLKHIFEKTVTHRQAELVRVFYETTIPWCGRRCTVDHWKMVATHLAT